MSVYPASSTEDLQQKVNPICNSEKRKADDVMIRHRFQSIALMLRISRRSYRKRKRKLATPKRSKEEKKFPKMKNFDLRISFFRYEELNLTYVSLKAQSAELGNQLDEAQKIQKELEEGNIIIILFQIRKFPFLKIFS